MKTPRFQYACPFFSIFPEAFRIIFFPPNVPLLFLFLSTPQRVVYVWCFRLYFALVRTPPVARLVNVQFADAEKSSRSRFLLKFLQKFSQIIILTSPISRSTLSPWLVLSLFSFSLIACFGYYLRNPIWFPSLLHYNVTSNIVQRKIVYLQCFLAQISENLSDYYFLISFSVLFCFC